MDIEKIKFENFKSNLNGKEGIVLLGAGGDLYEWVSGVTSVLNQEGIVNESDSTKVWKEMYVLTTAGGRKDLALVFNEKTKFNMGKMAMWRIKFGDCSWISDYVVNYENQHMGAPSSSDPYHGHLLLELDPNLVDLADRRNE